MIVSRDTLRPEPLLNKDKMINVTKQKLSDVCPAQMKLMMNRC